MTTIATPKSTRWRRFLALVKLADGWWLNSEALCPDTPLWGPYDTRSEALEARRSYLRNAIEKPWLKDGSRGPGKRARRGAKARS